MAELAFEFLAAAHESTRGTAVTPPTRYLPLAGTITPRDTKYRPDEARGLLSEFTRSQVMRTWGEWEAEGAVDPQALPFILSMLTKGSPATDQPDAGASPTVYRHGFVSEQTADTIKTATLYWGDPNEQIYQMKYSTVDSLEISADASGTDGVMMTVSGQGHLPTAVATPTLPSHEIGPLLKPGNMRVWFDTTSAIGTTEISASAVSMNFSINNNISYKYLGTGSEGTLNYTRIGRGKRHAEMTVVLEFLNTVHQAYWEAGTAGKLRVRLNGPIAEDDLYYYVQIDIYGPFDTMEWGELEGTNRTIELTVLSQYDTTAATDYTIVVQNTKATAV